MQPLHWRRSVDAPPAPAPNFHQLAQTQNPESLRERHAGLIAWRIHAYRGTCDELPKPHDDTDSDVRQSARLRAFHSKLLRPTIKTLCDRLASNAGFMIPSVGHGRRRLAIECSPHPDRRSYNLIACFQELSGVPTVLKASFSGNQQYLLALVFSARQDGCTGIGRLRSLAPRAKLAKNGKTEVDPENETVG
jgi:hypothetical protein